MTVPYLKFCFVHNPDYQKPIKVIEQPSHEEWEMLRGYEPTKIKSNYDEWATTYVARETQSLIRLNDCKFLINKIAVKDEYDPIISATEQLENFVKWAPQPPPFYPAV